MRRFQPADYPEIAGWYRDHGAEPPPLEALPTLGYVEPGVGAAFAYRTDSTVGLLDAAVTNPRASLRGRRAAIAAMTERLLEDLAAQGYRRAVVTTKSTGVERLVVRLGFTKSGTFAMLGRSL